MNEKVSFDGIVLVDKDIGDTSFDVVRKIKRYSNVNKVGHSGTLDQFATGLLVILLGQGTKLSSYLMAGEKRYLATVRLGIETDTLDLSGRVTRTIPVREISREEMELNIQKLTGEIEQTPPDYSAVRYNGKRAYKLARKGLKVDLGKRKVEVFSIDLESIELPDIMLDIRCSGGTYIRSLAADLGEFLGTGAHLTALRRLSSGLFDVNDSLNINEIDQESFDDVLSKKMISMSDALHDMKAVELDSKNLGKIKNGIKPEWDEIVPGAGISGEYKGFIKLVYGSRLVAVLDINISQSGKDKADWLQKMRVFN